MLAFALLLVTVGIAQESGVSIRIAPFERAATEDGEPLYDIVADEGFMDPRNRQISLNAIRRASFYDINRTIHVAAGEGVWSPSETTINLTGDVQVILWEHGAQPRRTKLETARMDLIFQDERKTMVAPTEVTISGEGYYARGDRMQGDQEQDLLVLDGNVLVIIVDPPREASDALREPVALAGQRLIYRPSTERLVVEERPILRTATAELTGRRIEGSLVPGERRLRVEGPVAGQSTLPDSTVPARFTCKNLIAAPDQSWLRLIGNVDVTHLGRRLQADELRAFTGPNLETVQGGVAEGNVRVTSPEGRLQGAKLVGNIAEDRLIATGRPRLTREGRTIRADQILTDLSFEDFQFLGRVDMETTTEGLRDGRELTGVSTGLGDADEPVRFAGGQLQVNQELGHILLRDDSRIAQGSAFLEAENILVILKPGEADRREILALVAWPDVIVQGEDLRATAQTAVYLADEERYILDRDAAVWQEQNTLSARRIHYWPQTRKVLATGAVRGNFVREDEDNEAAEGLFREQAFRTRSEHLLYDPARSVIFLWGGVLVEGEGGSRVVAQRLSLTTGPDGKAIQGIVAEGQIQLNEQERMAIGETLTYHFEDQRAIFGGEPAMAWEPTRGTAGLMLLLENENRRFLSFGGGEALSQSLSVPDDQTYLDVYGQSLGLRPREDDLNRGEATEPY